MELMVIEYSDIVVDLHSAADDVTATVQSTAVGTKPGAAVGAKPDAAVGTRHGAVAAAVHTFVVESEANGL
jgi:hypothetical protein